MTNTRARARRSTGRVDKRLLDVGMRVDVRRRFVWNEYAQREVDGVDSLFIVRLVRKYARNVDGVQVHAQTTAWDGHGNRVIWYHHFEETLRLV